MFSKKILFVTLFLVISKSVIAGVIKNNLPPHENAALMARYITHNSDWASVGTISVNDAIKGSPFVGLKSIADGPESNGTGIPYMLATDMDISMNDLNHDSRCTLFISLAQGDYCKSKNWDPQDPRCARIMLNGNVEKLQKNSDEEKFARNALYTKHPAMSSWPIDHGFYVVKLNIAHVYVLDFFGGIKYVTPEEYFAANPNKPNINEEFIDRLVRDIEVVQITF